MSKRNGTTKVGTFVGWGFIQPSGFIEVVDCTPSATADYAVMTNGQTVGWSNLFTNVTVGEKVILRKGTGYKDWVMAGRA